MAKFISRYKELNLGGTIDKKDITVKFQGGFFFTEDPLELRVVRTFAKNQEFGIVEVPQPKVTAEEALAPASKKKASK